MEGVILREYLWREFSLEKIKTMDVSPLQVKKKRLYVSPKLEFVVKCHFVLA